VHQFIFNYGFDKTKSLLAQMVARVDTVIVELARREDYVKHGKDHLLPEDPAAVLADCGDVQITMLVDRPRPVYRLRRRTVRFDDFEINARQIDFSPNPDPQVSRKYYTGGGKFLKLYRFTQASDRAMFEREVAALTKMRDSKRVPKLQGAQATAHFGAVLMSKIPGDRLLRRINRQAKQPLNMDERMSLTLQYLEIASEVHQSVGYQNDLQAHNLLLRPNGRLVVVDFEQAGARATNDPFGLLLWSVFDIWGGRDKERPAAIRSLRQGDGSRRPAAQQRIYPDFSALALPQAVMDLVAAAARPAPKPDWSTFVNERLACLRAAQGAQSAAQ
jgi:serine/threonine protein kinase